MFPRPRWITRRAVGGPRAKSRLKRRPSLAIFYNASFIPYKQRALISLNASVLSPLVAPPGSSPDLMLPHKTLQHQRDQQKNGLETEPALIDSNGRPFNFSSLFGTETPRTSNSTSKSAATRAPVDQSRLWNCLSQLGAPIDDRLEPYDHQEYKEDPNYIPGVTDPWHSIHFDIDQGIDVQVSHRTRIDCGLRPQSNAFPAPNRRQQNILDAAFEIDLYEERSKVISEQSQLFIDKSRELKQRKQGPSSPQKSNHPAFGKTKSALSLNYLGN